MTARQGKDYGPVQLATFLGLEPWQFSRARAAGLIPDSDRPRSRWSAAVAIALWARIGEIVQAVGAIPDIGATRTTEILSARLTLTVTPPCATSRRRPAVVPGPRALPSENL